MDFLADENFPLGSILVLRNAGHTIRSVAEDMPGSNDREVLACATENGLVILTFDKHYGELIHRNAFPALPGVVYFRFAPSTPEEPAQILSAIVEKGQPVLSGRFTVIERGRIRQRKISRSTL